MLGKLLRKTWFWLLLLGALLGVAALGVTVTVMHKTSPTEFCVSCHSMQTPLAEYQGSDHFQIVKGIRAECADCHMKDRKEGEKFEPKKLSYAVCAECHDDEDEKPARRSSLRG